MTVKVMSIEFADDTKLGEVVNSEEDRDLNTGLLRSQKYKHEIEIQVRQTKADTTRKIVRNGNNAQQRKK